MDREPDLLFGHLSGDHVAIWILGRPHADATDYWDANWLVTPMSVRAGAFRASVPATLRVDELQRLRLGLVAIDRLVAREATLESLEDWIRLRISMAPIGAIGISGEVVDQPGTGNRLRFDLASDTHLADVRQWIAQLDKIEREYPVVGDPGPVFPRPVT
jgi:hypothetical protein